MTKQKLKEKISLTIDIDEWFKFREYCNKNGYKYSTRINVLINKDVKYNGVFTR